MRFASRNLQPRLDPLTGIALLHDAKPKKGPTLLRASDTVWQSGIL
ncbi:hypothetical protein NOR53_2073 [gamma proteobacterium NOR5-3]|nr:hypothetical protein NOR53_2073 [gamma proteobacterium NOR5-3]